MHVKRGFSNILTYKNFCSIDYSHNTEKDNKHISSKRHNMKETVFKIIRLPWNEVIRAPSQRWDVTISTPKNPNTKPTKTKQTKKPPPNLHMPNSEAYFINLLNYQT